MVFEHQLVRIKNQGLLGAKILGDLILDFGNLLPSDHQRLLEARDFCDPLIGIHRIARHL